MNVALPPFKERARAALADRTLKLAIDRTTGTAEAKRAAAVAAFPEFDAARARGRAIKDHVIANLGHYLEMFERNATASGAHVHWAVDDAEARAIVTRLCLDAKAKVVTRSKSMLGEEIGLPHALADAGIERVETDLAEHIIQLAGETPSHIIWPAMHRTREQVAELLADEKVVGHAAGRMEFGPRALGARSILGDPRSAQMQSVMNLKIKFRESFRPFAPAVLREHVHEYFDMRPNEDSPYMLLVAPVREDKRVACEGGVRGLERLQQVRSVVPAITHVDGSARVQTVDESRHPRFAAILRAFERKTGMPMLINTSFNVRGEPIVCTPADAWRCFLATGMDALVIESFVMVREAQPQAERFDREAHLSQFALD